MALVGRRDGQNLGYGHPAMSVNYYQGSRPLRPEKVVH